MGYSGFSLSYPFFFLNSFFKLFEKIKNKRARISIGRDRYLLTLGPLENGLLIFLIRLGLFIYVWVGRLGQFSFGLISSFRVVIFFFFLLQFISPILTNHFILKFYMPHNFTLKLVIYLTLIIYDHDYLFFNNNLF